MNTPKYLPPLDHDLALLVESLADEDRQEFWSERASIREHSGGLSRRDAERAAWQDTVRHFGLQAHTNAPMDASPRQRDQK